MQTITHYKELENIVEENTQQKVTLHGCEFQKKFRLTIHWNPQRGKKSPMEGRMFEFNSRKQYTDKVSALRQEKIPAFLINGIADFEAEQ